MNVVSPARISLAISTPRERSLKRSATASALRMGGSPAPSVWQALPPHELARDDHFHDFRGAVADFEPDDVAHALAKRQLVRVAVMAVQQQALVNRLDRELRRPPLHHRRFFGVRLALIGQ